MEITQILIITVPYLGLAGLSAFGGDILRTHSGMRPLAYNNLIIQFGLSLFWFLLVIASVVIFLITSFAFIAVLFVVSVALSPLTGRLGMRIYNSLIVGPLLNDYEKHQQPHQMILWSRLLALPILFLAWIVSLLISYAGQ
jgi:hypothetical protein